MIILTICIIAIVVWYCKRRDHQDEIANYSRVSYVDKYSSLTKKYSYLAAIFAIIAFVGIIIPYMYETSYEETYTYWFFGDHTGTRTVWTRMGWISVILQAIGDILLIPILFFLYRNYKKYKHFDSMSDDEYRGLQQRTRAAINREDETWKKIGDTLTGTDRRDLAFYNGREELNFNVTFHCKQLSDFERIANLGVDNGHLVSFEYNNKFLSLRMKDGKILSAHLKDIEASFITYSGDNVSCSLKANGTEVNIYSYWKLFTDEEWYEIFNILTYCGITHNAGAYAAIYNKNNTKVGKTIKYANSAIKIINALQ